MPDNDQEHSEAPVVRAANQQIEKMRRALRVYRLVLAGVAVVVMALIPISVVLAVTVGNLSAYNHNSCEAGNTFRSDNELLWDDFIGLVVHSGHPTQAGIATANKYLALVAKTDKKRQC